MCMSNDFIRPENGKDGDVIVLTKPLGTQIAVNIREWQLSQNNKNAIKIFQEEKLITEKEALNAYNIAMGSMIRLNKNAAKLMHKYKAHGATDVTGNIIHCCF